MPTQPITLQRTISPDEFLKIWETATIPDGWGDYVRISKIGKGTRVEFIKIVLTDQVIYDNKEVLPSISFTDSKIDNFYIGSKEKGRIGDIFIYKSVCLNIRIAGRMGGLYLDRTETGFIDLTATQTDLIDFSEAKVGRFSVQQKSVTGGIQIENSKLESIEVIDSEVLGIWLLYTEIKWISIKDESKIGTFSCILPFSSPAHIGFKDCSLTKLRLEDSAFPEFTTLSSTNCKIKEISIRNFSNNGSAFFSGLQPLDDESTFRLVDSDLGKTLFINCELTKFNNFEFQNTKMLDVFVAGGRMPEASKFNLFEEEKSVKNLGQIAVDNLKAEQKQLAYGQFKKIYENRGDIAGSLRYSAFEMEAYRQRLVSDGLWKNCGDLIMLFFNKISTNYGNSWGQGLIMTLLSIIFCFSIFLKSIGYQLGNPFSLKDWETAIGLFSYAPHFVNPLRDSDSISIVTDEKGLSPFSRFWDFFSRIIVAYFAYQTIQAFRKLGKSGG